MDLGLAVAGEVDTEAAILLAQRGDEMIEIIAASQKAVEQQQPGAVRLAVDGVVKLIVLIDQ